MTLRARLVLGLLGLAATAIAITGVVTYREQRSFLLARVDDQIRSALANPSQISPALGDGSTATGGRFVPFGTYAEIRYPDGSTVRLADPGGGSQGTPSIPQELAAGEIVSTESPDLRVSAGRVVVGPTTLRREGLLVVAIPLGDVNETLHRLLVVELIVAGLVIAALAVASGLIVKLGLRPLRQMEETAGAIAAVRNMIAAYGPQSQYTASLKQDEAAMLSALASLRIDRYTESAFTGKPADYARLIADRKSTRLNSSHT